MTQTAPQPSERTLPPGPFVVAVILVYIVSFASQMLLSPPVTSRMHVVPFVLVQIVLIVLWLKLHIFRLRDAARRTGPAFVVAILYTLEVVIFTVLVSLIISAAGTNPDGSARDATILHLFVVLYFFSLLTGDPALGVLQVWVMGFAVLMLLPIAIGLLYTVWVATRRRPS